MPEGRVLLVSDYAGSGGAATGGAGHVVDDSFLALRRHNVDVRLIHGFGSPVGSGAIDLGGGDLREAGAGGIARTIYNPASRRALRAALAGENRTTTLVILHQWTRYLSPSAISVLTEFPMMVYLHDHFWACPNGAYFDFQQERRCDRKPLGVACVAAQCDRMGRATKLGRLARQFALIVAAGRGNERRLLLHLSERARDTIAPLLPRERHAIVHNPLDIPAERSFATVDRRYDIGYFGRLEPEKGLRPLIAALVRQGRSGLFVGEGTLGDEIVRHPLLELRRWQPRDEMAAAMRSCRIVALPSLWPETWGLIVPEAMAAGVPVLVSNAAGSAELIGRFGGGTIFDPRVPGDLDIAMAALIARQPTPVDRAGLRSTLSGERHAARIVDLAHQRLGIDLTAGVSRRSPARVSVSARGPVPRRRRAK